VTVQSANKVEAIYGLGISHNKFGVPLPDGTMYPDHAADVSGKRALEFLAHFNRVRDRDWRDCSFLDLGCSEGSTTFELSQMGSTVYGVEGREDAVHRAQALKSILDFEKTHFSVGNVNDPRTYRAADGIFNAGILYHLDDPVTCLERCAENARLFLYVDTGHAPRSDEEREKSKFAAKFGQSYKIDYKGLQLDVIDFEEPNVPEKQTDGTRRGPRSAIGNSKSVWLSHESAVALMAALGFPYHETISDAPKFPRLRTCFFRTQPRPTEPIGPLLKPLPQLLPEKQAFVRSRERDAAYIRSTGQRVLLIGREPLLSAVRSDLVGERIQIAEEIAIPGDGTVPRGVVNELTRGKGGLVVVATPDVIKTVRHLTILDRFAYAFASFALARQ
jgi:SAM-dependent methyltransferase